MALGTEHPDVVQSLNNLAEVYHAQGRFAETESLRKRARAIEKKAAAQGDLWQRYMAAGVAAFQQGNYPEAEKQFAAAFKSAEGFGPQDLRSATSLNNLAAFYHVQRRYAEAGPLYRRALAVLEKALGPDHFRLAQILENYSALLHRTAKDAEAAKMAARAKAIRAKHASGNPAG